MLDTLLDRWPVLASIVAGILWLGRLEYRGLANERGIRHLWKQRAEDLAAAQAARDATNSMLRELQQQATALAVQSGRIEEGLSGVRNDIARVINTMEKKR